jgi:hypothetical protein
MMHAEGVFQAGHILNDTYRVVRLLGRGGMGCLYEVDHLRLPRKFALKVMSGPSTGSTEYMLRFRREAEILASLDHPNVVQVMDWNVTADHKPYLVMELLSGEDLSQLLQRCGALPPRVALSIFAQAVAALEVAHSHGITHRDLKPANLELRRCLPYRLPLPRLGRVRKFWRAGGNPGLRTGVQCLADEIGGNLGGGNGWGAGHTRAAPVPSCAAACRGLSVKPDAHVRVESNAMHEVVDRGAQSDAETLVIAAGWIVKRNLVARKGHARLFEQTDSVHRRALSNRTVCRRCEAMPKPRLNASFGKQLSHSLQ